MSSPNDHEQQTALVQSFLKKGQEKTLSFFHNTLNSRLCINTQHVFANVSQSGNAAT